MELNRDQIKLDITELLKETARAHHDAFASTDGADPEWPTWYADYLYDRLSGLLNANFTRSELIYLLVLVEKRREKKAPGSDWVMSYADFLVDRYI